MKDILTLAVVNFAPVWGDKDNNLKRICEYTEAAALRGAQMVLFPETALTGYDIEPGDLDREERMHRRLAETIPGPATDAVCALTRKYGIYAAFGMAERDAGDPARVYNAAAVCGPDGLIGSCRKIHLPFAESLWADSGEKPFLFETPWGPVGIGICYDVYCFPEVTRYARAMGARLFLNCTAICTLESPGAGGELGNLCLQYLAVNNDLFIASSNLCGRDVTSWFMGGSGIIGPSTTMTHVRDAAGEPFLAPGADESGLRLATIDLSDTRHSFLASMWNGGMDKCDWQPDRYADWFREARETDYWAHQ